MQIEAMNKTSNQQNIKDSKTKTQQNQQSSILILTLINITDGFSDIYREIKDSLFIKSENTIDQDRQSLQNKLGDFQKNITESKKFRKISSRKTSICYTKKNAKKKNIWFRRLYLMNCEKQNNLRKYLYQML